MELLNQLAESVCEMEVKTTENLTREALSEGINPLEVLNNGLIKGMDKAGKLFEEEEYFVPELLMCSDAMYTGLAILEPELKKVQTVKKGKVVIGVVEGDTHDIGKNIVKMMLETANFEVIDLGRNVPIEQFIDTAVKEEADIIGLSTLMTTTMGGMEQLIQILKEREIRDRFKVLIGGGPISQSFAAGIGADGYGANANDAVRVADNLISEKCEKTA